MNFARLTLHGTDEHEQWVNMDLVQHLKAVTRRREGKQATFTRLYFADKTTVEVKESPPEIISGVFVVHA